MKRVLPLPLLVCFVFGLTALDNIPDPPAIKQKPAAAASVTVADAGNVVPVAIAAHAAALPDYSSVCCAGILRLNSLSSQAVMRHAGNSSPPNQNL